MCALLVFLTLFLSRTSRFFLECCYYKNRFITAFLKLGDHLNPPPRRLTRIVCSPPPAGRFGRTLNNGPALENPDYLNIGNTMLLHPRNSMRFRNKYTIRLDELLEFGSRFPSIELGQPDSL